MDKRNIIDFPKAKLELSHDEYEKLKKYTEKMKNAKSWSEMLRYRKLAYELIEKAKNQP